jgi:hypothetical protein
MERVLSDCFWCGESYERGVYERCPNCATGVAPGAAIGDIQITFAANSGPLRSGPINGEVSITSPTQR